MADARTADTKRKFVLAALLCCLVGAAIASYLLWEHLTGGAMLGCSKNGTFDCETVNRSVYSEIKGVPIALWGLVGYLVTAFLVGRRLRVGPVVGEGSLAIAFLFALMALAMDAFLFLMQSSDLHAYCLWCIASYFASAGLLATTWIALGSPARVGPGLRSEWEGLGKSKTLGYVLIAVIGVAFGMVLFRKPPDGVPNKWKIFNAPPEGGISLPGLGMGVSAKAREEIEHAPFLDPGPGGGYARGAAEPKLTIVEFGDLECPACRHFSWTMDEFLTKHPNDVRWVFRHYPLDLLCNPNVRRKIHEFACVTARGAEAAGLQGKFWDFESDVYKQNDDKGQYIAKPDLSPASLEERAKRLGLNIPEWKKESESDAVMSKIIDDIAIGAQVGLESTPTIFVNGRMISGGRDLPTLEAWLEMAKKGELPAKPKP